MATSANVNTASSDIVISMQDILFECPACGKSLVVDEAATGLTVECPKCHINVIVPPREHSVQSPPAPTLSSATAAPKSTPAPTGAGASKLDEMLARLTGLSSQLKELQTQRTELSNRIASRSNEMNRDFVMLARLDTSQQQVLAELNQIVQQIVEAGQPNGGKAGQEVAPTIIGSSAGHTRVSFRG